MKLTEKERAIIFKHHPAVTFDSCKRCGGYNTVMKEFDKFEMSITATCKQCSEVKVYYLKD